MIKYFFNPPTIIKKIYNEYQWNSKANRVLLTFDDGPTKESTEIILKLLDEFKLQGLFFCVGNNLSKNPQLVKEILSAGHEIGNHTYNHKIFTQNSFAEMSDEIQKTNQVLSDTLNYKVNYFRPPHGRFNKNLLSILEKNNLKNIMWSLLTYDYKSDLNIIKFALKNYLESNSIIVFHDSIKSKNIIDKALKMTIEIVDKKNFMFGKVDECLN